MKTLSCHNSLPLPQKQREAANKKKYFQDLSGGLTLGVYMSV